MNRPLLETVDSHQWTWKLVYPLSLAIPMSSHCISHKRMTSWNKITEQGDLAVSIGGLTEIEKNTEFV